MRWLFFPKSEVNQCEPQPEMIISVTGASGTASWCGETWNLPGDSGDERIVCPTIYRKAKQRPAYSPTTDTYSGYQSEAFRNEVWINRGTPYNTRKGLSMERLWGYYAEAYYIQKEIRLVLINIDGTSANKTDRYRKEYRYSTVPFWDQGQGQPLFPASTSTLQNSTFQLSLLTAGLLPTYNDHFITDDYFGSYNDGSYTYSWRKGVGW